MLSFTCPHDPPWCSVRHYGSASLSLVFLLVVQALLISVSRSVSVAGDTVHLSGDLVGIGSTWLVLLYMVGREAHPKVASWFTRANVVILFLGGVLVAIESAKRFGAPVETKKVFTFFAGVIGLLGNILAYALLTEAKHFPDPHLARNHKVNLVHMLSDAWLSVGVIAAAILGRYWGTRVDAVFGLLIALYIMNEAVGHAYTSVTGNHYPAHVHRERSHEHARHHRH